MSISKGKILIVDDEQYIGELLIQEFSRLGYDVIVASDGDIAISKLSENKFNLVISDMKMPKLDGVSLLKVIKEKSPETEVILITGHATIDNALHAMRSGAYDFLQKPFDIDELSALAEKAIEKSELKILVALYESSSAIFSSVKLEELFPVFMSLLKNATLSEDVSIFLKEEQKSMYLATSSIPMFDPLRIKLDDFIKKIYKEKPDNINPMVVSVENIKRDYFDIFGSNTMLNSILLFPLVYDEKIMGALLFTKTAKGAIFTQSDLKNILIFASQIVQSINNTKLYEKLEIKIAELESTLSDLATAEKEIKSLQEEACTYR